MSESAAILAASGSRGGRAGGCVRSRHGADAGGAPRRFLRIRPVAWLGLISYGVYLWHLPIALWLASSNSSQFSAAGLGLLGAIHALQTPSLLLLTLVVSVGAAATSFYVVELPFLRLKERRVR